MYFDFLGAKMGSDSGAGTALRVVGTMGLAYWIAYGLLYAIIGSLIYAAVVAVIVGGVLFFYLRAVFYAIALREMDALIILILPIVLFGLAFLVTSNTAWTDDLIRIGHPYFNPHPDPDANGSKIMWGFVIGLLAILFIWTGPFLAYKLAQDDLDRNVLWVSLMFFMLIYAGAVYGYLYKALEYYSLN